MLGKVVYLTAQEATDFLLPRHYSGRKPQITKAFGWEINGRLVAVCTFGKPASPTLCDGICGKEYSSQVYELNRLCRVDDLDQPLSAFVSACLRRLRSMDWIIVSYADTGMNHNGYIYQACNFLYTGCTKQRTDKYTGGLKHSRHYDKDAPEVFRQVRTSKHRYVFFATLKSRLKREWKDALKYPVQEYPKGKNKNYVLGEYMTPQLVKVGGD
jgi:hypothetical protein